MGSNTKQANRGAAIIDLRGRVRDLARLIGKFSDESAKQDKTTNERLEGFSKVLDEHADRLDALRQLMVEVDQKHEAGVTYAQTEQSRLRNTRIMRFLLFFSKYRS